LAEEWRLPPSWWKAYSDALVPGLGVMWLALLLCVCCTYVACDCLCCCRACRLLESLTGSVEEDWQCVCMLVQGDACGCFHHGIWQQTYNGVQLKLVFAAEAR
jgi:hypothetical protein